MIMMTMVWEGVTKKQYEDARKLVAWETKKPEGAVFHVASFSGKGLHVTDVWESAKDFQNFVDSRLMPGVKKLGIEGQPKVEINELHAMFAPALQK